MMQQAIPYGGGGGGGKAWSALEHSAAVTVDLRKSGGGGKIRKAVEENPVVVVGRSGCCMVHVVRRLLLGQGVNPVVCEVGGGDDEEDEAAAASLVAGLLQPAEGCAAALPAVFVGGRLVGGLDRLMAVHIAGELVPILKQAGALWL